MFLDLMLKALAPYDSDSLPSQLQVEDASALSAIVDSESSPTRRLGGVMDDSSWRSDDSSSVKIFAADRRSATSSQGDTTGTAAGLQRLQVWLPVPLAVAAWLLFIWFRRGRL